MLSIITITWQDPRGLQKTLKSLESLAGEKFFEHVIVDSSPSLNQDIVRDLKNKNWPLVYMTPPAKGIYAAMNEGVTKSNGEFLWFLNGGDELKSSATLQKILKRFEENKNADLIFARAETYRGNDFHHVQPTAHKDLLKNILGENRICHQSVIYRKSSFLKAGLFSTQYRLASDYEHFFRLYEMGAQADCFDETLVTYTLGGRSDDAVYVFKEFRDVQKKFEKRWSLSTRAENTARFALGFCRVRSIAFLRKTPLLPYLKPLWLRYKRRAVKT